MNVEQKIIDLENRVAEMERITDVLMSKDGDKLFKEIINKVAKKGWPKSEHDTTFEHEKHLGRPDSQSLF